MNIILGPRPDLYLREQTKELANLVKASLRFRWRFLAVIATLATCVSAAFQVLNYFHPPT